MSPSEIDGGIEFNATYLYGIPNRPDKSPFWVEDDRYMVTFGPVAGYRTFSARSYPRWIPPRQGAVFVLVSAEP